MVVISFAAVAYTYRPLPHYTLALPEVVTAAFHAPPPPGPTVNHTANTFDRKLAQKHNCIWVGEGPDFTYPNAANFQACMAFMRATVKDMFFHGFNNYMEHAFPKDELKPLSCGGVDTLGGYALTLIDSLDTIAIMGNRTQFELSVDMVTRVTNFRIAKPVSVFETTIRVLGGLLSAHMYATELLGPRHQDQLLSLAIDLADRLVPAFNTATGIPFNTISLSSGVPQHETPVTCLACLGSLTLEFGTVSRLMGNPLYHHLAKRAVVAAWKLRTTIGLMGCHINAQSGQWTEHAASISGTSDSYYEYVCKAAVMFDDPEYAYLCQVTYETVENQLRYKDWYASASIWNGIIYRSSFESLQAFWPGLQVLLGDLKPAIRSVRQYIQLLDRFAFLPEAVNMDRLTALVGREGYPLRPELVESLMALFQATQDRRLLNVATEQIRRLLAYCWTSCGFANVKDVRHLILEDQMDSFFLAETLKYLYLLFTPGHPLHHDAIVFTTEAHPLPVSMKRKTKAFQPTPLPSHSPWLQLDSTALRLELPLLVCPTQLSPYEFALAPSYLAQLQQRGLVTATFVFDYPHFKPLSASFFDHLTVVSYGFYALPGTAEQCQVPQQCPYQPWADTQVDRDGWWQTIGFPNG